MSYIFTLSNIGAIFLFLFLSTDQSRVFSVNQTFKKNTQLDHFLVCLKKKIIEIDFTDQPKSTKMKLMNSTNKYKIQPDLLN